METDSAIMYNMLHFMDRDKINFFENLIPFFTLNTQCKNFHE